MVKKLKGAHAGLRQFLAPEGPLKMIKNAFFFHVKSSICSQDIEVFAVTFGHAAKLLHKKDQVIFKLYDVTACLTNNYNIQIAQYLEKWRQLDNEIWSANRQ